MKNPNLSLRMNREQAYRTQETFEAYLPEAFAELLGDRAAEARGALAAGDHDRLMALEAAVDALRVPAARIRPAPALRLGSDRAADAASRLSEARELVVGGGYVPQMLFSGAATRLGMGAMYFVDPRAAAGKGPGRFSLGLGPRQLLQYRAALERAAKDAGDDPAAAVGRASLLVHLSETAERDILADLRKNSFYGFDRTRVYFLTQPCGPGFIFEGDRIVPDPSSPVLPAGHGYPLSQTLQRGESFQLDENGEKEGVTPCVVAELRRLGVKLVGSHRVNDLTRLGPGITGFERLALALSLMDDLDDPAAGSNMVVELVDNPENQKGGFWKVDSETGVKGLAETLNLRTPELRALMEGLVNPPYNAFRNLYKLSALEEILPTIGFTPYIRFRHGRMYPETITGEATEYAEMRTEAFRKPGELIHDFKEKKDLPEALRFLDAQDADPDFAAAVKSLSFSS